MEILKVIETLQSESFDLLSYKMGATYADAVTEAVSLLVAMGERIVDLEAELETLNATGLTPEDIAFFQDPKMVEICKRIHAAFEKGLL